MILIYCKYETIGINADRFTIKSDTSEVKIYCKGDVAFVGKLTTRDKSSLLCDELVRGLKSEITAEFKEVEEVDD